MKKLTLAIASLIIGHLSYSQCTPDQTITEPGFYPEQLDTAYVDSFYNFRLDVLAVGDTSVMFMGQSITATIDSVVLDTVVGLPSGFVFGCNPSRCTFINPTVGCVNLSGIPTSNDVGAHPISIYVTAYARWSVFSLPQKDTITEFILVVNDLGTAQLEKQQKNETFKIVPNPALSNRLKLVYNPSTIKHIYIYNIFGELVFTQETNANQNETIINGLSAGLYHVYTIDEKGNRYTRKAVLR